MTGFCYHCGTSMLHMLMAEGSDECSCPNCGLVHYVEWHATEIMGGWSRNRVGDSTLIYPITCIQHKDIPPWGKQ